MKALSVLLLLALGLGSAWWTVTHPDGTLDDARREADALGQRLQASAVAVRDDALAAFERATGSTADPDADPDADPAAASGDATPAAEPGEPAAATLAAATGTSGAADPASVDRSAPPADPALDPLAAVVPPVTGPDGPAGGGATGAPEALSARLAALEARIGDATTVSAANVVRGRLTDAERRLDATANRESATLERLEAIDARLGRLAERLEASAMESTRRQDATDARLDGLDEALAALEGRDEALSNRLDTLDTAAPEASGESAAVEADAGEDAYSGADADGLEALATAVDRRLAALETRLASAPGATDPASDERLDALARRVETLAAALPAAPQSRGAAVDAAQAEIRTELAAIGERVGDEGASDDAPALGEALESTRERLGALEERVRALPASSDAADEAEATQDALETQLRALERRIEALPSGTDPAIVSSISEVREQVDALASRGFVTQEELRERQEGRNVEYKIYFDRDSTEIGEDAADVLDAFIARETERTTGVSIFGFTDRQGPASYNQRLALERATNVRSYLIQNGLPYNKVSALNALGEDAAAAILPDEAEDAEQRVVVLYAAQP